MAEKDRRISDIFPLNQEQTENVIEDLDEQGSIWFTWEMLQAWIRKFGRDAKVADVQEILGHQENQETRN